MSWLFGSSQITVEEAKRQIYEKIKELAPRVEGYSKGNKDDIRWLADKIGLRLDTGSPAASPRLGPAPPTTVQPPRGRAGSPLVLSGGRRRKARKTRRLRR